MSKIKIIQSTGNQEEDAKLLAGLKDSLGNKLSFDEAKEREREANRATGSDQSGNALTDQPRIKGQVLTVMVEDDDDAEKPLETKDGVNGKKVFVKNGTVTANETNGSKIIELDTKPVEVTK